MEVQSAARPDEGGQGAASIDNGGDAIEIDGATPNESGTAGSGAAKQGGDDGGDDAVERASEVVNW